MTAVIPTRVQEESPGHGDLLAQAKAGDAESFCELCRIHESRLLRQATVLCGDSTVAQDLAQDTFFEAWKSIQSYNGRCQFFTWLCAILFHRQRNLARKKRPLALSWLFGGERESAEDLLERIPDPNPSPGLLAEQGDQAALLQNCLRKLPDKQREVLYLRFYGDESLDGIAAALGCSVGTVKSRLFNGLDKLRTMTGGSARLAELRLNGE